MQTGPSQQQQQQQPAYGGARQRLDQTLKRILQKGSLKKQKPQHEQIVDLPLEPVDVGASTTSFWKSWRRKYRESVVQVINYMAQWNVYAPYKPPEEGGAKGSGFFIDDKGHILTNAHVVQGAIGGEKVGIRRDSGSINELEGEIIGVCFEKDVALLRLYPDSLKKAQAEGPILPLVLADDACVGQLENVMAVGFPLGQEGIKYTTGEVSGYHLAGTTSYIQMSAPINPGNSGGPLINEKGQVIGINSAGEMFSQNVGYAIPTRAVISVLHTLFATPFRDLPSVPLPSSSLMEKQTPWSSSSADAKESHGQKLITVPSLKVKLQRSNEIMLEEAGIKEGLGGLLAYEWINRDIKPKKGELQMYDFLVGITVPDPFPKTQKGFNIRSYYHPQTPGCKALTSQINATKLAHDDRNDMCNSVAKSYYNSVCGFLGHYFETTPGSFDRAQPKYPRLRVAFKRDSSALVLERQDAKNKPFVPTQFTKNRKLTLYEFLDMLPTGIPMQIDFFRGKKRMSYWTRFLPCTLAENDSKKNGVGVSGGIKKIYPNYERPDHELFFGVCFMPLLENHIHPCDARLTVYKGATKRNRSWVVVSTPPFPGTGMFDLHEIKPGQILRSISIIDKGMVKRYEKKRIENVDDMRGYLYEVAQQSSAKMRVAITFMNNKMVILDFWKAVTQDIKAQRVRNIISTPFFSSMQKLMLQRGILTKRPDLAALFLDQV